MFCLPITCCRDCFQALCKLDVFSLICCCCLAPGKPAHGILSKKGPIFDRKGPFFDQRALERLGKSGKRRASPSFWHGFIISRARWSTKSALLVENRALFGQNYVRGFPRGQAATKKQRKNIKFAESLETIPATKIRRKNNEFLISALLQARPT